MDENNKNKPKPTSTVMENKYHESKFEAQVNDRLDKYENKIADLQQSQARIESDNAAIMRELQSISAVINRPTRSNLVGWISTSVTITMLLGSVGLLALKPLSEDIKALEIQTETLLEDEVTSAYHKGKTVGMLETIQATQDRLTDEAIEGLSRITRLEAKVDAIGTHEHPHRAD